MTARYVMGTFLRVGVQAGESGAAARAAIYDVVQALEEILSYFREDSDVSRINRAAGRSPVAVRPETLEILEAALRYARRTDGAFDPTFRSRGGGCYADVRLDSGLGTVFLPRRGMVLDLGGIGKGFALDHALERARQRFPISGAVMDFGGQWLFWRSDGRPRETVVVEDPRDGGGVLSTLTLDRNGSVSTSSQSQRPGHLVEPSSGRPAAACLSATAVAETATTAEALSTALFVAGPGPAERILSRFPGARAVLH